MKKAKGARRSHVWGGKPIKPGERATIKLEISETYTGVTLRLPVHVWRARAKGPTVFVSAAVHGDEINGTGAIRQLMLGDEIKLAAGTLVLIPVVNVFGFERHSRYLPDRRDLNRSFPGRATGSLTARLAHVVHERILTKCDFGIDLHTAAVRRTNFPNVRGDMNDPSLRRLATAFGSELIVDSIGPRGSLRRCACRHGCPTIILEAGEVWKVEPTVVQYTVRGVRNVLIELGMMKGEIEKAPYQTIVKTSKWVRTQSGGFLKFHVTPGELVKQDQALATNTSLFGKEHEVIKAPHAGIVLGMTTMPSVAPGDPVVHIAVPEQEELKRMARAIRKLDGSTLGHQIREDLATNVMTFEAEPDDNE